METGNQEKVEQMVDYIMKNCLWQFHSRAWDRKRQNEEILKKTMQILCGEPVDKETPADRCYWVDAVCLAEAFQSRLAWLADMHPEETRVLLQELKERIDFLTITGSLNQELTVSLY